jgi:ketosteroid isomerase-like protein
MSQENVELVRRVYEGWARGDFSESDAFDPEVEFDMIDWPEGSNSRGLHGMSRSWRASLSAWINFRAEPTEFIESGEDVVVVLTHVRARGKESGLDVEADTATVWTMKAGKVARLALYWNTAEAFKATRLAE